ncbi:MAG: alcohol dehydrogenase catalytic domain-containing protein [Pyrinomonadaceae bacterium]
MKALRFERGSLALADIPRPDNEHEALVRVLRSGICNTDIEITRGYAEFQGTLGHEFVGLVERAPDSEPLIGKRVVGEINAGCGVCEVCSTGDVRHCSARTVLGILGRDGSHAEFLQLPTRNLILLPDDLSDDEAVFAEPLAAAYGIAEQVEIGPAARVAVIGDGKLGLLCAMCLVIASQQVTVVGKHTSKLRIAKEAGAETLLVKDLTRSMSQRFDIVVEASGSDSGFDTALEMVKPRGKIVLKSTFNGRRTWNASKVVVDEVTIVGSRCGLMRPAIDLLVKRAVPVTKLISEHIPLSDGLAAMRRAASDGVLKVLLNNQM